MLEVSARSTTQIENGKGVIALHRTQERGMVLAHVVIPGAVPVIFGRPVIMPDGYFRNAPQVCFIEHFGRLVRISPFLHRGPRFPAEL